MHAKVLCTGFVLINLRSKRKAITHLCKSKPLKSSSKVVAFLNLFSSSARPAVKPAIRETGFAAGRGTPSTRCERCGEEVGYSPQVCGEIEGFFRHDAEMLCFLHSRWLLSFHTLLRRTWKSATTLYADFGNANSQSYIV